MERQKNRQDSFTGEEAQKAPSIAVVPSLKDSLRMFGRIPVQNSSAGLQCLCCFAVCSRCKCGNAVDVEELLTED